MLPIENVTGFFRSVLKIRSLHNMISVLMMSRMISVRTISWIYNLASELGDAWNVVMIIPHVAHATMRPIIMPLGHPTVLPPRAACALTVRPLAMPLGHPTVLPPRAARHHATRPRHRAVSLCSPCPPHVAPRHATSPCGPCPCRAAWPHHANQCCPRRAISPCGPLPRHRANLAVPLGHAACKSMPPSPRNPKVSFSLPLLLLLLLLLQMVSVVFSSP